MPIEGPVRELPPSDLLQLLYLSRRTGILSVRDERGGVESELLLEEGALVGVRGWMGERRIGQLLVRSGGATERQIESALERQRSAPGQRLGEILVESEGVRSGEVERLLRFQVEEAVFELVRRADGHLRFAEAEPFDRGRLEIALATDRVLMDAVRRLDEWTEVLAGGAGADPLPRLAVSVGRPGEPLRLQTLEWEVLAEVDGNRALRAIARRLGRGELEVARALYGLASSGVVEIGSRPPVGERADHGVEEWLAAAETALEEGRLDEAEQLAGQLAAAGTEGGEYHLLRGRLAARRGRWTDAVAAFEQAVRSHPGGPAGYYQLARAAVRGGDLGRAHDALASYRRLGDPSASRRAAAERLAGSLAQLRSALEDETE